MYKCLPKKLLLPEGKGRISTLAACGSQCTKPCLNIISAKASLTCTWCKECQLITALESCSVEMSLEISQTKCLHLIQI